MSETLGVEQLSFRYRNAAERSLDDISLAVGHAELLLIAGGSGKSTLLRCINGQPAAGLSLAQLAQLVGTVLQDPERQIVAGYVGRQVAFGPENLGWPIRARSSCPARRRDPAARARLRRPVGPAGHSCPGSITIRE